MLKGCHRFHSTHKVGPWTLLTSNPSNVLLAALKTGEIGDWLTAVVRWHIQYLLKQISQQWHDQVSEWALRVQTHLLSCMVFRSGGAFVIHCLVSPFVTVCSSPSVRYCPFITICSSLSHTSSAPVPATQLRLITHATLTFHHFPTRPPTLHSLYPRVYGTYRYNACICLGTSNRR